MAASFAQMKHGLKQPIARLISSWASSTNFGAATSALPFASRTTFKNSSSSSSSSSSSHSSSAAACINPSLHKDRINFSLLLSASFASLAVIDGLASGKGSSSSNLSLNGDSPLSVHDSLGELVCAFINEKGPGKVVSEDVHFINEELGVLAVFDGVGGWKGITRPEAFPLALRQGLEHELNHQTTTATAGHAKHASQTLHSIAPNSIELPAQSQSPNSATHNTLHSHSQHHSRAHSHNHPASSTHSLHPSSSSSSNPSSSSLSPSHLLSRAHEFAKHEVELGSSTACIIVVDKESAKFDSANLGDSGWYLFKSASKNIELWSEEQQHYWNCPYQIGGSKSKADKVDMADLHGEIGLDDGDILLLATDGLSDNLFREEINKVIQNKFRLKLSRDELHDIAKDLYNEAHKKFDSLENTPFREHYFKHTKKHQRHANFFEGSYGKPDDLCVIIAQYSKNAIEKKASEKPL